MEEVFALYLPEDLMRVEPPAPWWVNTGGLREGGGGKRRGERDRRERERGEREGRGRERERNGKKRFGSVGLSQCDWNCIHRTTYLPPGRKQEDVSVYRSLE